MVFCSTSECFVPTLKRPAARLWFSVMATSCCGRRPRAHRSAVSFLSKAGLKLVPRSQNDSVLTVNSISNNIARRPEIDHPIAEFGVHFLDWTPHTRLSLDGFQPVVDRIDRTIGRSWALRSQEFVQPFNVATRLRRPFQRHAGGSSTLLPVFSLPSQASASAPLICSPVAW